MAKVSVTFKGGAGSIDVSVTRNDGTEEDKGTISKSGSLDIGPVSPGDTISLEGVASNGGSVVTIDVPTAPSTPDNLPKGPVNKGYVVITYQTTKNA